ncbi:unnamed protein product [Peniophora sp. CBMAI 1063]|nr:unnamed protein product [Peniophora sp. CBMAI 1063]
MGYPQILKPAPEWSATVVEDGEFVEKSSKDYLGQWVILFFYPMDFTFVCPTEILAFNAALPAFKALNTSVLGVSTDSKFTHFQWATTPRSLGGLGPEANGQGASLAVPLIADKNHKISTDYGCLLEDEGFPLRATYLIDPKGILRQFTVNDTPVGRSVEETIRLIKAFQFTEEHGEVCPADWSEGALTIKATPSDKLAYFGAVANGNANAMPTD